mmetsp:Transcript_120825/g.269557  ORF Transcript_120825/g.269557 Transcript_120825/m.269557 type:complete len:253 (+) Transcript_120825:637-1395(+)
MVVAAKPGTPCELLAAGPTALPLRRAPPLLVGPLQCAGLHQEAQNEDLAGHMPPCILLHPMAEVPSDQPLAHLRARCRRRSLAPVALSAGGQQKRTSLETALAHPRTARHSHRLVGVPPDHDVCADDRQHRHHMVHRASWLVLLLAQRGSSSVVLVADSGWRRCGPLARRQLQLWLEGLLGSPRESVLRDVCPAAMDCLDAGANDHGRGDALDVGREREVQAQGVAICIARGGLPLPPLCGGALLALHTWCR